MRNELKQQYPGKDNRLISKLLGELWKGLTEEKRQEFTKEAKMMADERLRSNPECWKRKKVVDGLKVKRKYTRYSPSMTESTSDKDDTTCETNATPLKADKGSSRRSSGAGGKKSRKSTPVKVSLGDVDFEMERSPQNDHASTDQENQSLYHSDARIVISTNGSEVQGDASQVSNKEKFVGIDALQQLGTSDQTSTAHVVLDGDSKSVYMIVDVYDPAQAQAIAEVSSEDQKKKTDKSDD